MWSEQHKIIKLLEYLWLPAGSLIQKDARLMPEWFSKREKCEDEFSFWNVRKYVMELNLGTERGEQSFDGVPLTAGISEH